MSLLLRAFQVNAIDYDDGMRWMGLDRRQVIGENDVAAMAWALHANADEVRRRLVVLEWRGGGRWVHLAGQRLSRWIAPTSMLAKVCPICLRETGYTRILWMTRAAPACRHHGYSLLQECASCGKPIRWARPGVRICRCGRFFKSDGQSLPLEPELQAWLNWTEAVLQDNASAVQSAQCGLPPLLHAMSLDGAYRLIEAFGLQKGPGDSIRTARHSSVPLAEVGEMLVRGLRRLADVDRAERVDANSFDAICMPVLSELAASPASDTDGLRAAWLLDVHRAAVHPSRVGRVGVRPRRQVPLFL